MKIVGIVCVGNEENRYLEEVLEEKEKLCDTIIALGDAPTDNTPAICQSFKKVQYHQVKQPLFATKQWLLKQTALNIAENENPDYILAFDADELLDNRVDREALEKLTERGENFTFQFVHLWDDREHIRVDKGWRGLRKVIFYKYKPHEKQEFRKQSLHCGVAPLYAHKAVKFSGYIVKHLGYMNPLHRSTKVKRYKEYDAQGFYKPLWWYQSINQEGEIEEFNEEEFVKSIYPE